jgi:glycosyltransferase involved in cell wall biosynthesis
VRSLGRRTAASVAEGKPYVHFCYGAFLRKETARRAARGYPTTAARVDVIPNAVDLDRMRQSEGFDRRAVRSSLGLDDADIVFAALGHFGRKGFPLLLEALRQLDNARFKLVVIGGQPNLVKAYRATAAKLAVAGQVAFVGHAGRRPAVPLGRRHLRAPVPPTKSSRWLLEAGGRRPPTARERAGRLAGPAGGADGETGYVVDRTGVSMAAGLRRFGSLPESRRQQMATAARAAAQRYGLDAFVAGWAKLYAGLEA